MSKTTAGYVKENLDIGFTSGNSPFALEDLVGLSIRRNPKRAHLLVSDVLGKHVPQKPGVIDFAGKVLGAMVSNVLNGRKANDLMGPCFNALHTYLHNGSGYGPFYTPWHDKREDSSPHELITGVVGNKIVITEEMRRNGKLWDINENDALLRELPKNETSVAVVGYAETATALGFLVAAQLDSWYVHSTRFYTENDTAYGTFEESHSHATSHQLIPADPQFLNSERPVVLVDDEISTGNTAMNTIAELESVHHHDRYIVAALIDGRNDGHKETLAKFAADLGVSIEVVALASGTVTLPADVLPRAQKIIESESVTPTLMPQDNENSAMLSVVKVPQRELNLSKYGVDPSKYMEGMAQYVASRIWDSRPNTVVLGLEEFMFFPLMVAKEMAKNGGLVKFSSTTQSPVAIIDDPGYSIRNAVTFNNDEGQARFAYNIKEGFERVIIVVEPGENPLPLFNDDGLIRQLIPFFEEIILVVSEERVVNA